MLAPIHTKRLKQFGRQSTLGAVVACFTLFAAFPFYWMLITTFKRTGDLYNLQNNRHLSRDRKSSEQFTCFNRRYHEMKA